MAMRGVAWLGCSAILSMACGAQMSPAAAKPNGPGAQAPGGAASAKPLPSPPAVAEVSLEGKKVVIRYNAPSMRGRKVMGGLVPYGKVWRTGANPATTLVTPVNLKIGTISVPAGTYTLYTLPAAETWMLIVNKQTGQWGTVYNQAIDLGRTAMVANPLAKQQEVMSISFEHTKGRSTELHVKWESTDEYVTVTAE